MGRARTHRSCSEHIWETPPLLHLRSFLPPSLWVWWPVDYHPAAADGQQPRSCCACVLHLSKCSACMSLQTPTVYWGTRAKPWHFQPCMLEPSTGVLSSPAGLQSCLLPRLHIRNVVKRPQHPHSLPGAPNPHPPSHQVLPRNSKEISRPVFPGKALRHNSILSWSLAWLQ